MRARIDLLVLVLLLPLLVALPVTGTTAAPAAGRLTIEVLSNRADLISGGDALVAVRVPKGVKARTVHVKVGKRDVTKRFTKTTGRKLVGLVRGLDLGRNVVRATAPRAKPGRAVIVNHPNGGPVFSGPQTKHYRCQPTARDASLLRPTPERGLSG